MKPQMDAVCYFFFSPSSFLPNLKDNITFNIPIYIEDKFQDDNKENTESSSSWENGSDF